jgi:hypothetical protein
MAMAMMALAVGMQVFRVIHDARLHVKPSKWCASSANENRPDLNAAQRKGRLMFRVVQPIGRPTVVMVELFLIVTSDPP